MKFLSDRESIAMFSDHVRDCIHLKSVMDQYYMMDERQMSRFHNFFASRYRRAFESDVCIADDMKDETVQVCFLIALKYYTFALKWSPTVDGQQTRRNHDA